MVGKGTGGGDVGCDEEGHGKEQEDGAGESHGLGKKSG